LLRDGYYAEVNADSESGNRGFGTARWIALGFVVAFATSVLTVIYTGLMVEGSRAEFDAGFRALEMTLDQAGEARFFFDSTVAEPDATLELEFPEFLDPVVPRGGAAWQQRVAVVPGKNEFAVELRAVAVGSGYVVARLAGAQPIGRDSVFVTVTATPADQ
jgi:hypothetical protein